MPSESPGTQSEAETEFEGYMDENGAWHGVYVEDGLEKSGYTDEQGTWHEDSERFLAEHRAYIANERDFAELPEILKEGLTPHFAQVYDDVYRVAFGTDEELEQLAAAREGA